MSTCSSSRVAQKHGILWVLSPTKAGSWAVASRQIWRTQGVSPSPQRLGELGREPQVLKQGHLERWGSPMLPTFSAIEEVATLEPKYSGEGTYLVQG